MCKIFTLTNASKVDKLNKLINVTSRYLLAEEKDGFGYSILTDKGMFGERTNSTNFSTSFDKRILSEPFIKQTYNRFGIKGKVTGPAMFHGRTSTNDKSLRNVHPINKHGWSLIHNGVVSNKGLPYDMITTNDTEHIIEHMATKGIESVEKCLSGYYAFTAIDKDGVLHIAKDDVANLYYAYIETIQSGVFATTSKLIESICKEMDWQHTVINELKDNVYLQFRNGEMIHNQTIKPLGWSYNESRHSSASLGKDLSFNTPRLISEGPTEDLVGDDSIEAFLDEMYEKADDSYIFRNARDWDIDYKEFISLPDDEKLLCTVVRPDGTIADPYDYFTEKLYGT